ncbi:MAG: HlyD family secretion protein [Candidatus Promineifilaceae bacterium]|jgi:HlyD family secretion protein
MLRNRTLWMIAVVALLGAGGWYGYSSGRLFAAEEESAEPALQTSVVRQGDILISASGAGTVIPAEEIGLSFSIGGVLTQVPVAVGSKVNTGDILGRVDDADAQQALAVAELNLRSANAKISAMAEAGDMTSADISVAQADISLEVAQENLAALVDWVPDEDEIAIAEAQLASAQASLNSANGQSASNGYSRQVQEISLEQTRRALADTQERWNIAYEPARDWEAQYHDPYCPANNPNCGSSQTYAERILSERESADSALLRAQENLTIAEANFNGSVASQSSNTAGAQSNMLSAQQTLARATAGPAEDEIKAAERAVQQAELQLASAKINRSTDAVNTETSIEQAQLNLTKAQINLENTVLRSPINGTILSVAGHVGERIGTGGFVTIANIEQPLVEIFIDETDLDKIAVGNDVTVEFDALPDLILDGSIASIDPRLTDSGGLTAIRAVVQLDPSDDLPAVMPLGANASVEVIGASATNALIVPIESLREISEGSYGIFVVPAEGAEPEFRLVEVGLQDFTFAEIFSGVELGETVTTGIIETN